MERLEKIIREASEQSGRSYVPELFEIFPFEEAVASLADQKIIFHLGEGIENFKPSPTAQTINIFIGPEGGFTDKEVDQAKEAGCSPASLGSLTLRGETAAIIATYRSVNRI